MKNCTKNLLPGHSAGDKNFVSVKIRKFIFNFRKIVRPYVFLFSFIAISSTVSAQLGIYEFTGAGTCPNQNPAVTSQPANATFSNISSVNTTCWAHTDKFNYYNWNEDWTLLTNEYNEFTITAANGFNLNLTSLSFNHYTDNDKSGNKWFLSSSVDNYTSLLDSGIITLIPQNVTVNLPPAAFAQNGSVTFRFYIIRMKGLASWIMDDLSVNGTTFVAPLNPANPTSNSPQCAATGITLNFNGTPPAGETWYWQTSVNGTSTTNSAPSWTVFTTGTYYLRARNNTTLVWSSGTGSVAVVVNGNVTAPVFAMGATSTRCKSINSITYSAAAANSTGIAYSLDLASIAAGLSIDPSTGELNYNGSWIGTSIITATATGCNGPVSSTHTATTRNDVEDPVFTMGASSSRCQGAGTVTYTATSNYSTGITYNLDAASLAAGNTINSSTGAVTYIAGWAGTTTITATASGCNGPKSGTHTVTITTTVGSPVFTLGATSTRCQGAGSVVYDATASNTTGITYSLDNASSTFGNTINATTGEVTYLFNWNGTSVITASAAGCNGPTTATHTVTITPTVGTPVFVLGATSTRCQGANSVIYAANSTNSTGIIYSLDAASEAAGNTINAATGAVTYVPTWTGVSIITATASGCNGPVSSSHNATSFQIADQPVTASPASVCNNGSSVITVGSSQMGVSYTLRDNSNNATIAGPTAGTGAAINFTTGALTATKTYNVLAQLQNSSGALAFTGLTDQVIIPDANGLDPANLTVSCWVKLNAYNSYSVLMAKTTFSSWATGWGLSANNAGNKIAFFVDGDNSSWTESTSTLALGTWYHVAATFDGTSTRIYLNGVLDATQNFTGTIMNTVHQLKMGSQGGGFDNLNGTMDEASVWNRVLNATEIQNVMNNTLTGSEPNLAAYYIFENGTGSNTVTDIAGGNNGTLTNMNVATAWVTRTSAFCSLQMSSTATVTVNGTVGSPVFTLGTSSTRCQGAGTVTYTATASASTGISYSLDAASIAGGNAINSATGEVTYVAGWSGTSVITATAAGCGGPKTANHTVTITPTVGTPVFSLGATSTRCQGAGTVTYTATASNSTSRTYSLDATTAAFPGNSINSSSGAVTYAAGWSGTTTITVSAAGCNGPSTASHTVTITPTVGNPVFPMGATSTRCQGGGSVSYAATASNSTSISYSIDGLSISGGCSINASTGLLAFAAGWTGTTTVTALAAGCNGPRASQHVITTTPTVGTPVFSLGATTTRCQGANTVTYTATASNNTGITYSLDAASLAAGNTINSANGAVTYVAGWTGPSVITASANGCNGPKTASHTVNITPTVGTPAFTLGATSTRCQGSSFLAYTATATNSTSINYSLDAASIGGGNTINATNGTVVYAAAWSGTTIITAMAAGCNGPSSAIHTVSITPTVGTPVFTSGATSIRCQGAGTINYGATATNSTGITYSLDAASLAAGNTINTSTGDVSYVSTWNGTTIITASAAGCNGPKTANHNVTVTGSVGNPVFALGMESVRDQAVQTVLYSATAANSSGITYALDAASIAGGNTINTSTGAVTWSGGWYGISSITATATGCNGPASSSHIVNINTIIAQTPLYLSDPGQLLDRVDPVAANIIPTAVSYPISSSSTGVIIDAQSTASSLAGPITVSHTTGTGSNRFMLVGISQKNKVVTGVTYGGIPLTLVGENNINGFARIALYQLVNPPSGTANVIVNFTANPDRGAVVAVTTYRGVNQTNPLGTFVTDESKNNTPTINVVSAAGELVYDIVSARNQSLTVSGGQTERWNISSGSEIYGAGSTKPGAASVTMSWTTTNTDWAIGAVSIKPANSINNITFTQSPALCNSLTIKAQTIQVLAYINETSGTMPLNPAITATLKYDSINVISLSNPVYNSASKIISWTGVLGADKTVPAGKSLQLHFISAQPGVEFQIEYHSRTKPSRISLLPVSTFIDFVSFDVFNAPYPGGTKRVSGNTSTTYYVRAEVTTPFGYEDITGLDININPPGTTVPVPCVDSTACTRTYELPWTTAPTTGMYFLRGTAKEGLENLIKNSDLESFDVCSVCPPVALNDSATGAGGAPVLVDVLANDYDPNNNLNTSTLSVSIQPDNGSAFISNNKVVYLPNGSYTGKDTLTYNICDSTGLCANAFVYFSISPVIVDPCSDATKTSVYYVPYSENEARIALDSSSSSGIPSNNIRTVMSMKFPYPGMTVIWDHWEDIYENNPLNPQQSTTQVWGDGNPYNGIAPGYASDIIPAGASIILDNIIPTNPRVSSNIFYDGRDKIITSGKITVTQVCGEPSIMAVQCMKTNVTPVSDYGTSFTIPAGNDFNSRDFRYTSLFIRASEDSTIIEIDKDNNGTLETKDTLDQGEILLVNGGVRSGATVTATRNVGIDLHIGGRDGYSSRELPIFPATWYSNTYYTPVPTTGRSSNPADTNAVFLYNSLNRPLTINWSSGIPSSGSISLPPKTTTRFPLAMSQTAAYKFVNPTGESFTAMQVCDSYSPGSGGNSGTEFDWAFNLISESRLTDFATIAWAPGSIDGSRNDNPIWVTPVNNTTIYVKYNGNINGNTGSVSPCGFRYDVSYPLNTLNHRRLLDLSDNDQSGLAVFTCDGTKIAAVYGEDASTANTANPSWDVGSTIQPFCKQKLLFANDDYARTMVNQPVTISILLNDFGFLAVLDPTSVVTAGLLQPKHGTVSVNANGTVIYTPNNSYIGKDTFEYRVCSTPTPVVCDNALVYIDISTCPAPYNQNVISGTVFIDKNSDGINNDGGTGIAGSKVYLYSDGNCNTVIDPNELIDSVTVDGSGTYQFITYPEKFVADDFDGTSGARTCANGSDGDVAWFTDWVDAGDPSTGFCNTSQSASNTDCDIFKDATFSNAIRLKDNNVSATRTVNLSGAAYAFLSFDYRRKSATLAAGEDIIVQASRDGSTFGTVFTIAGDGNTDSSYVSIYNQDITNYTVGSSQTYIRFLTNNNVDDQDTVYIDKVKVQFIRYPQCYITRYDSTTIPAYYHTTTVLKHNFTATSMQTCLAPFDFGIAKNKISVSGTLFLDGNGLTDNLINGSVMGTVSGFPVYAYLSDSTDLVVRRVTVNAATGAFTFPDADVFTNYNLRLSTISVNIGDPPPSNAGISGIPGYWVTTGDSYGTNNMSGTGIKSATATCAVPVSTTTLNVTNVNFGMEKLPDSDNRNIVYTINNPNVQYDVTGGLTGTDPEDGILGAGKTYKITQLPFAAILFYNGSAVSLNQVITSFNPALLKIDPDDDTYTCFFRYASRDAAGLFDPSPATVTLNWSFITLPSDGLVAQVNLNGNIANVKWSTESEQNTRHFVLERSLDNINFTAIGNTVTAAGNSTTRKEYEQPDNITNLTQHAVIYYRVKLVDIDGRFKYSNVVYIRLSQKPGVTIYPNPFQTSISVSITSAMETIIDISLIDVSGKMIRTSSQSIPKGISKITIDGLGQLPAGAYLVEINDKKAGVTYQKVIKNEK